MEFSFRQQSLISIMEESNPLQTRQKTMTSIHRGYTAALQHLKQGRLPLGIEQLQSILSHEFMTDTDMENLKYSALMSLANIHEQTQQTSQALSKYWQALRILTSRSQATLQQGMFNLRQFNEERGHSEFTILLRMLAITEKERFVDQTIYILKRAITLSPSIWRQNLLIKLRDLYQAENKVEALKDLNLLMSNKKQMESVLAENILPERENKKAIEANETTFLETESSFMKKLTLKVNVWQREQHRVKYSSWENLLTLMYILLKCQLPRSFSKKKYKKLEESKEWATILKQYSPLKTSIEIILVDEEETENKIDLEEQSQDKYCQVLNDLAAQILKAQFIKKKAKKVINPLEELTKNPSLNSKDPKNKSITQTKSIYSSINEYYKDNFSKSNFKKELLGNVKFLDEARFNQILGKAYYEPEQTENKKDDEMDEEEQDRSASNQQNKQKTKEKKGPKAKKLEQIAQNQRLGRLLKSNYFINQRLKFNNIYEAVENITYLIIRDKYQNPEGQDALLKNSAIKKCLSKNILKVIQASSGFFTQLIHPQSLIKFKLEYLEILLQKLEQLSEKECKSKSFKDHQQTKKDKIISYIKKHFTISILETRETLENNALPVEAVQYYSTICLQFVRLNHIYGYVRPSEVSYYRKLFAAYKMKEVTAESYDYEVYEKKILDIVDAQIEKYQKKISKLKFLAITQEQQVKSAQSVDQIFKKDQELSSVLPLLKIFNSLNTESKNKSSEMVEEVSSSVYLESFVRLSEIFNKKLEMQSAKEFNSRILLLIADLMKIKQVIGDIYERILHSPTLKIYELGPEIFTPVLFHLIRIYLLNLYEENDNCIRIIFYVSNIIFRSLPDEKKLIIVPKCIILFDQLIKYKKFKPELINVIRKKFYQNLILKNLVFIYQSPLFRINQAEISSAKKKKQRKNSSKSQSEQMDIQSPSNIQDENIEIKQKIRDVLHDIYFCPEKQREFSPKKLDEAVGYFMYLLKAYHEEFYCPIVELEYDVSKIIKRCFKVYTEKRGELFDYCQKFKSFKLIFDAVMNGDENSVYKGHLVTTITRQQIICECCSNLRSKYLYCVQSLFLLGKFFESQTLKDDITIDKQQWLQDLDKDESYYFEYLSLNLDSQIAWENIIRINANKSYMYFDSLIGEPFESYKGKFLYTKRVIQYINDYLQNFKTIIDYGNQKSEILNALKIKQRQYFALLKEIQAKQAPQDGKQYKEYKDLNKKYKEGLKKIDQIEQKLSLDVKMRYIRLVEVKMKVYWINFQAQAKQQKKKDVIDLDNEVQICPDITVSGPSRQIFRISELFAQIQSIINDLPEQQKTDYVIHLEQDLVVQAYMFLYRNIDEKLEMLINSISESVNSTTQQMRSRFIKQFEQCFQDIFFIQAFFDEHPLTVSEKYRINQANLTVEKAEIERSSSLFDAIFSKSIKSQLKISEAKAKSIEKLKQKKQIIIINVQDKKMKEQNFEEELPKNKSSSENDSIKQQGKNKEIVIDIPRYCCQRIKKQIKRPYQKNLAKLKSMLISEAFSEKIQKISKIFSELIKFYLQLPKFQTIKRYKNRRSVGNGLLQCSEIIFKYAQMPDKANEVIKQLYNIKSDELVAINMHNEKIAAEKNELLAQYYNRVLVHQTMKIKFIQHLLKIYEAQGNKENLIILARKLLKLSKDVEKQAGKEKEKQKLKQKQRQKQKQKQKSKPMKQVIEIEQEIKQAEEVKQPQKEKKSKSFKQKDEKQQEIKCYFLLFCQATSSFVNILKAESQKQAVNDKYQKNLLQFKHRIRKYVSKSETNYYLNKLDAFITFYEQKYSKKIKMKKAKTEVQNQKEKQEPQPTKPTLSQIQVVNVDPIMEQQLPQLQIITQKKESVKEQNVSAKPKRKINRKKLFDNSISKNVGTVKKQKKIKKKQTGQVQGSIKKDELQKTQKVRQPRKPRKKKSEQIIEIQVSDNKPEQ